MLKHLEDYYNENAEYLESAFTEYCFENGLGGFGEDAITITDDLFFDFIADHYEEEYDAI